MINYYKVQRLADKIRRLGMEDRVYAEVQKRQLAQGGDIHIDPSKRGSFTAAAKSRGLGTQEFASRVLANKENYSPATVRKANFARNAASWNHADGGPIASPYYDPRVSVYFPFPVSGYAMGGSMHRYDGDSEESQQMEKNDKSIVLADLPGYIQSQRDSVRNAALEKSLSRIYPSVPIMGYDKNGNPEYGLSCIYTALDNYSFPQSRPAGNGKWLSDYSKWGFKQVPVSEVLPGDIVQKGFIDYYDGQYHPVHGMIFNGYDERGIPRFNYSDGSMNPKDADAIKKNATYYGSLSDRLDRAYRFVGTPEDEAEWTHQFYDKYRAQPPLPEVVPSFSFPVLSALQTEGIQKDKGHY